MKHSQIAATYICFTLLAVLIAIVCARADYEPPAEPVPLTEQAETINDTDEERSTESETVTTCPTLYFTEDDVIACAKMLWGEARGCNEDNQAKCVWVVCNRVDDERFPDTIIGVLEQPSQFFGYSENFPVDDELYDIAFSVLLRWSYEKQGLPVYRDLDESFLWFTGDGVTNHFREAY